MLNRMKSFLTGLATGLAIGYLTAPRPGKDTRQQLTDTADTQTKALKDTWSKLMAKTEQLVEDVKRNQGSSKPEPNLFADMQAGKLDKYLDESQSVRHQGEETYDSPVNNTADATRASVNKAKQAQKS